MDKRALTLQDLVRRRQAGGFVGRRAQLGLFEESLALPVEDPRRRFLFSVHGDAGVGKTYLVHQLVRIARERDYVTAYVDEEYYDVLATMEAIVGDLESQGVRCKEFREQLGAYRQRRSELDGDPGAPEGLSSLLTQSAVRIGLRAVGDVPFVGAVAEEVNPDVVASQVDRLRVFLSQKFRSHGEVRQLMAPVEALTPVFLTEVAAVAGRRPIALFFDTYERTGAYLEGWLLDLLAGRHGSLPGNLVLTISGQRPLDVNRWGEYLGIRADLGLEAFTDTEARQLLADRGVSEETVVEVILRLSGRLPVLVAMLAQARPEDASAVGDPSGSAVERFLKWETDPRRRTAAQHAALPRRLDQESFAVATSSPAPSEDFAWLCRLPFVAEHTEGFQYHDVVRTAMLRVLRRRAPREWQQRHTTLADHYQSTRDALGLSGRDAWKDDRWQNCAIEEHYHRLCAHTTGALPATQAGLVDALAWHRTSVPRWTQMVEQAGKDAEAPGVVTCGQQLSRWSEQDTDSQLRMLSDLTADNTLGDHHRSIAYRERGRIYRELGRYDEALADFTQAIDLDPKYSWAIASRGVTYLQMDRYEEALTDLTQAIDLNPKYSWAITNRGETYLQMDRYEEALTDLTQAIDLNPTSDWAITNRGVTYRRMGRYEEALTDLTQAIDLNPTSDWAITNRGEIYRRMGRYEEALTDLTRAIDLDEDGWTYYQMALVSLARDCAHDARQQLQRGLDVEREQILTSQGDGWRRFNVAVYLMALSVRDQAREQVRESLERGASIGEILVAIQDFEDLQVATGSDVSEILCALRTSLHRLHRTCVPFCS
ncbi:MAG: tetratricopeptide repeat protein [Pseudonocardiales bacterium]|nr:tetratricopeptide repeat protein [Pseudonocardiales bacterium]